MKALQVIVKITGKQIQLFTAKFISIKRLKEYQKQKKVIAEDKIILLRPNI